MLVSLAQFGIQTIFISRLPDNAVASAALNTLKSCNVNTDKVLKGGNRVGLYYLETGAANRPSRVIYDRDFSAFSELKPGMIDWESMFEDINWFHWTGISPALTQNNAEVCLEALKVASAKGLTISADLNYRSSLWKYEKKPDEVIPELVSYCDILVGGEGDSELMLGIPSGKDADLKRLYEQWKEKFPKLKYIAGTSRKEANASQCLLQGHLWTEGKLYSSRAYEITHIVDRVGAGDAFMAGLVYGIHTYEEAEKAINFATGASCLKYSIPGDFNLVSASEVERLVAGDTGSRISR